MKLKELIEARIKELEARLKDPTLLSSTKTKLKNQLDYNRMLVGRK